MGVAAIKGGRISCRQSQEEEESGLWHQGHQQVKRVLKNPIGRGRCLARRTFVRKADLAMGCRKWMGTVGKSWGLSTVLLNPQPRLGGDRDCTRIHQQATGSWIAVESRLGEFLTGLFYGFSLFSLSAGIILRPSTAILDQSEEAKKGHSPA